MITDRCRMRGIKWRHPGALTLTAGALLAAFPAGALAQSANGGSDSRASEARTERSNDESNGSRGTAGPSQEGSGREDGADARPSDLDVARHVRRGSLVSVGGRLSGAEAGDTALVEVRTRSGWTTVARPTTRAGGRFSASWRPARTGSFQVRVRPLGEALAASAGRIVREDVTVYRASFASWYGPGFYGRRTACGQTITRSIVGVAHKRLPCGTRVTFRYGNRTVTAPVIDRGPFVGGREWDLTVGLKNRLGFPSTGVVLSTR